MMRKFYQNKLWRDKLVELRQAKGAIVHILPLSSEEFKEELSMKLLEEANEVYEATNEHEMIDEIVDVLEAIDCILDFHGISKEHVLALKEKKQKELGSYTKHQLIDYAEYPAGSDEEKHCLEHSDRYPELTNEEEGKEDHGINNCCR